MKSMLKTTKKLTAIILSLAFLLTMIPVSAFAAVPEADWTDDEPVGTSADRYWPLPEGAKPTLVKPAEPIKNPSLRYIGTYTRPDGREVLRVAFAGYSGGATGLWYFLVLKPDEILNDMIDWSASHGGKEAPQQNGGSTANNHDYRTFNDDWVQFGTLSASQGGAANLHVIDLGNGGTRTVTSGLLGAQGYEMPMDLVLKEGQSVKDLPENPIIQGRLMNDTYTQAFSVIPEDKEAGGKTPYSSYTMSTFIPITQDLAQGILKADIVRQNENAWQSASSYMKYDEERGILDVYYKSTSGTVGQEPGNGVTGTNNGEQWAFRQSFDSSLIDILKPQDESGTVAQVFRGKPNDTLMHSDDKGLTPRASNRIDVQRDDISVVGDVGVIQVASDKWPAEANTDGVTTITTSKRPGDVFLPIGTGLAGYGNSTIVRYFVDKEKMREKFGTTDLVTYEFFSTYLASNITGVEQYQAPKITEDIVVKQGSEITFLYDGRRDLISAGTFDTAGLYLQIGDDQFGIDWRSTTEKAHYSGRPRNNYMRELTMTAPFDIVIKAGTPMTVYARKTLLEEVSRGMTVTFNADNASLAKTFRFERPVKDGVLLDDENRIINEDGTPVANPTQDMFVDVHQPSMVTKVESYSGGILIRTADAPDVDEVFTDSTKITGRTKYDRAHIYLYQGDNQEGKELETEDVIVPKETSILASDVQKDMVVNNENVKGYEWDSDNVVEGQPKLNLSLWAKKDTPLYLTNQNVQEFALESEPPVVEQVQAKVTFLPGGPLGDETYEKIAPLNKEYRYNYDFENNKRVTNPNYKASGFGVLTDDGTLSGESVQNLKVDGTPVVEVDGQKMINYINHKGKAYDINNADSAVAKAEKAALAKRQWPKVKRQDGKILLGWTTVKLEDKLLGETAEAQFNKLLADDKVVKKEADWEKAKKEAYVYNQNSPLVEGVTVYGVWGEPTIRLHSNFDSDAAAEGKQEVVENQAMDIAVVDKLLGGTPATEVSATLKKVHDLDGFQREGYSLVGFSRDENANEPDTNITGSGLSKDIYLRDGDTFKLADETSGYTFGDVTKGLDLYAVWKKNFTITADKTWLDKTGGSLVADPENIEKLKFALIGRPAVGVYGQEVVVEGATYYPIEGTVQDFNGSVTWDNIPGYDAKGRRMSYLVVELADEDAVKAFNANSTNWKDYGITITEADENAGTYGHKEQVVEFVNTRNVDTFTSATTRLHKTEANPNGVNPHPTDGTPAPKIGYFDTQGYVFSVVNQEVNIAPPTIKQGYTGQNTVFVIPPKQMADRVFVYLPDGKYGVFKKNADGTGYDYSDVDSTTSATGKVEADGTLSLGTGMYKFQAGDKFTAVADRVIGGQTLKSSEATMTVKDRLVSAKPENLQQKPLTTDSEGTEVVPISFKVPEPVTDRPSAGTTYTVILVDEATGDRTPTEYKYTIPKTGAVAIPGSTQTINVPKDVLAGKQVIIQAEEPDKVTTNSDQLPLDLEAPSVEQSTQNDLWRRWTDLELVIDEAQGIGAPVQLTYTKDGEEITEEFGVAGDAKVLLKDILKDPSVSDLKLTVVDKFGNETEVAPQIVPLPTTGLTVYPIRAAKDFVILTVKDQLGGKITVNVYPKGTDLDAYDRDEYLDFVEETKPEALATAVLELDQDEAMRQVVKLKTPTGESYKFKKGDIVDIVRTVGEKGEEGYARSTPFTRTIK